MAWLDLEEGILGEFAERAEYAVERFSLPDLTVFRSPELQRKRDREFQSPTVKERIRLNDIERARRWRTENNDRKAAQNAEWYLRIKSDAEAYSLRLAMSNEAKRAKRAQCPRKDKSPDYSSRPEALEVRRAQVREATRRWRAAKKAMPQHLGGLVGKSQREKGARGERATVNEVKDAFPWLGEAIKRGWQARAGDDAPDVDGVPGVWIEVKAGAKPNPRAALQQAIAASARKGRVPVVVIRDDRKEPFAVMRWPDLLRLLSAVEAHS